MAKRGGLAARYQHSYETRDSGGGNPAFDWRKVKGEVKFFKPKEGKNRINIIPYEIKTKNHPLVKSGAAEIGDLDYVMDIWTHRSVGPSQADVVCLKRNFGKPCPICEAAEEYKQKGKQKEYEGLRASRRVLYNVQDVKNPDAGVQVFEVSHFLFEKELIEEARASSDDSKIIDFADVDDGKTVLFRASEASLNNQKFFEFKSFQFIDREDQIEDEVVESAVSFDEVMKVLSYEQIERILYGKDEDDDDPPARDLRDEDDDPPKKDKPKSKKDEDDDDPPPKKDKPKAKDEDDDDDDPPPKKDKEKDKGGKASGGDCPHGHKFGKDCDEFDECNHCKVWDKCVKAQ